MNREWLGFEVCRSNFAPVLWWMVGGAAVCLSQVKKSPGGEATAKWAFRATALRVV